METDAATADPIDTKEVERLHAKHARAQHKLRQAEDELAATRIEGQQEIQRARLQAERKLAKKRREVARRAEKVARVERALAEAGMTIADSDTITPEDAAEIIEDIEVRARSDSFSESSS